jgi:hypothetical protein
MTTVIERVEGHYEVHELSQGKGYTWCPECVVVECECGERLLLTLSEPTCRCGANHISVVRKELALLGSCAEPQAPWQDEHREWLAKKGEYLRSESNYLQEWSDLD